MAAVTGTVGWEERVLERKEGKGREREGRKEGPREGEKEGRREERGVRQGGREAGKLSRRLSVERGVNHLCLPSVQ